MPESFLRAAWPAPENVRCLVTTRRGGASEGPFSAFNLALHVGDAPVRVQANRARLQELIGGRDCQWIRQVHDTGVLVPEESAARRGRPSGSPQPPPEADALYTRRPGLACVVLTADCLPVAFCDRAGREIAVAHAGWRGLCAGVLENTLARFQAPRSEILAWLGPAIGPCHFEVGGEVREAFLAPAHNPAPAESIEAAFQPGPVPGKWMANLYTLARARLEAAGVTGIFGGGRCTYCEDELFYSYRRNPLTGRFATVIYRNDSV